ncbi:MAG: right-handed parallel beta-helix repeat-containing protein [Trichloromonas sp.]|nr:right-handed parallel beta-helix repeat-containing protein [Trichloromonas sp.]
MSALGRTPVAALVLLALFLGGCLGTGKPLSGSLSGDIHWRGRILIDGDLVLAEGSRVVIASGTEVLFLNPGPGRDPWTEHPNFVGSELIVRGELMAEGTATAPIVFRHLDPAAAPGSWGGVNFEPGSRALFAYCRFTQADSAVHSQEATVSVSHSLFENNLVGIRFYSSAMRIENNLLRGNGTAIRFHFGAPTITGNDLRDNRRAFFITAFPRDYRIEGNRIAASSEYAVVLGEEVPDDVMMPGNYWVWEPHDESEALFYDGRMSDYLGRVRIEPRLEAPPKVGISWNR